MNTREPDLGDQVVLVTGGARGQGAAHVREFHRLGAAVVVADVLTGDAEELARELGDRALAVRLDVADSDSWAAAIATVGTTFGDVSALVNNAGIVGSGSGHVAEQDIVELRRVLDVNLVGALLGIQAVVPGMRSRGGGAIVNISSMVALNGRGGGGAYSVSKWALRGLTKNAAVDLAPDGIRVNAVLPGLIATPMNGGDIDDSGLLERNRSHLPLGRLGRPDDITPMVVYLCSPAAGYVTGADIVIDGGWTAI